MEVDDFMEDGEVENDGEVTDLGHHEKTDATEKPSPKFPFEDPDVFKKRAERFGISEQDAAKPITKEQLITLYQELEVPEEEIQLMVDGGNTNQYRLQAIHIYGTDEMSTEDVFEYFKGCSPASVEWINDSSCNAVWLETWQAARAMLEKTTVVVKSQAKPNDSEAMDQEASEELQKKDHIPFGVWKRGIVHPKAENLFVRFATVHDCKVKGAQKNSTYYLKHGNPNYGGVKGLMSNSRKRRLDDMHRNRSQQAPVDSKNPWGSLALEWGSDEQESWQTRFESKKGGRGLSSDLVRRLGHEPPRPSPSRSRDTDSGESEDQDFRSRSGSDSDDSANGSRTDKKRPRMRMYADEEERRQTKTQHRDTEDFGDKIAKLRSNQRIQDRLGPVSDLRSKIKNRLN